MGRVPRPLLVVVTAVLLTCGVGGFVLGLSQTLPRSAPASDEETASIPGAASSNATIRDAQPLVEPPPPPKPKKAEEAASDEEPDSAVAPTPLKIPPLPSPSAPPAEAAPGAPPPPAPKLPADLPPT